MDELMMNTADNERLIDLRTVHVNTDLPKAERLLDYIRQIKKPNQYRIGKYVVCLSYSDTALTVQEVFCDLALTKAGIVDYLKKALLLSTL